MAKKIIDTLPTSAQLDRSKQLLAEASAVPGLVALSNAEKRQHPTMAEGSELVCRRLLTFMVQHPDLLSPRTSADLGLALAGLAVMEQLRELMPLADAHAQHLHDTHHAIGHLVKRTAMQGYALLKHSGQELGLHELQREMAAVFAYSPQARARAVRLAQERLEAASP